MATDGSSSLPFTVFSEETPIIQLPGARIPIIFRQCLSDFNSCLMSWRERQSSSSDLPSVSEESESGYTASISEGNAESLSRFYYHGRPILSTTPVERPDLEAQCIRVTTTISVVTTAEPDFGIGMGLYQVTTITAGTREPDPEILDPRQSLSSREQDVHPQVTPLSISTVVQRFRALLAKLSVHITASFVLLGIIIFVLYAVKKHDLGTGSGLCALVWTVGGAVYKFCLHDEPVSQEETPEQRGRELRRLA
jgi:hypothetical protein